MFLQELINANRPESTLSRAFDSQAHRMKILTRARNEIPSEILRDPSDPKALSKPEQVEILNDRSDPFHMTPDALISPTKVEDSRAFNEAHADLVASFHELTNNVCLDRNTGGAYPQAVARWQAERNLEVDGKIGPHTLAAAKADSKRHTESAAQAQVNSQPASGIPV